MNIKKEYIKVVSNDNTTHLKCMLYYDLGGINYFTYADEPRGYYVSVTPVNRDGMFESFAAFTGYKQIVHPCSRKSKKQQEIAESKYTEIRDTLIERLVQENGYKLEQEVTA